MLLKKGIVRKTFVYSTLLTLLVTLISFSVMYFIMPGYYLTQKEATLQNNLANLAENLAAVSSREEIAELISDFSVANNVVVLPLGSNGELLLDFSPPFITGGASAGAAQTFRVQIRERENSPGVAVLRHGIFAENMMTFEKHIGGDLVNHLIVNATLQPIDEARGVLLSLMPYVVAVAIAFSIILSGIYARQISKPILKISDAAKKMQEMEQDVSSGVNTDDELGRLSEDLDGMYMILLDNIDILRAETEKASRLERYKTELMQSASHELKTPIAALSGMIEGMIDNVGVYKDKEKYLAECKAQVDKLGTLVAEILGASKSDIAAGELELSDVHISELTQRAVEENIFRIREKNLVIEQSFQNTVITTDPTILYHTISNLVSNAVKYTPDSGLVRLAVTDKQLVIENRCEPIAPEELPKLFEPFYTRSYSRDKTKSGTGLGLFIVKRNLERLGISYESKITDLGFLISLDF